MESTLNSTASTAAPAAGVDTAATATNGTTTDSTAGAAADSAAAAAAAAAPPPPPADEAVAADPNHPLDQGGCFVCKKNDQLDLILLCDGCDGEYHTFCMKPPVLKIPKKKWFCDVCKAAGVDKGVPMPKPVSK